MANCTVSIKQLPQIVLRKEQAVFAVTDGPRELGTLTLTSDCIDWRPAGAAQSYNWPWKSFNLLMSGLFDQVDRRRK